MKKDTIAFIGLGLIGGSIAKNIKKRYPDTKIYALASRESTLKEAYRAGVIENDTVLDLKAYATCDIIFLCAPVGINISYLEKLKPMLSKDCLLTDVGSVKCDIQEAILRLGLESQFIGGHPMAGSETIGFQNASTQLLENAYYILTCSDAIDPRIYQEFHHYIETLGAIPIKMSPEEHDYATATISHLPHVISASLVNLVCKRDDDREILKTIAAGGFRDITRISSSSPVMWQHICTANSDKILTLIDAYKEQLLEFRQIIADGNPKEIEKCFSNAKEYRDSLPIKKKGVLPDVFEFYLDLDDKVGGIATIAASLAEQKLSIKNIGIIHNREFQDGVLHIEMYDLESMEKAIEILSKTYRIHRKK